MKKFSQWFGYMKRTVAGRAPWQAEREFTYYSANQRLVAQHRLTQDFMERDFYSSGLRILKALGILDARAIRGARVLEVGAGECQLANAIACLGGASEVWAEDAIPKQIWAAAERHAKDGRLRCLIADACDMPFADGQFDLVVGNLILHHIHPLESALSEVFRVLAPGGLFAAFEPNPLFGPLVHQQTSENEAPVSPSSVMRAAARTGFEGAGYEYWWSRLETTKMGWISPGYRFHGRKPGNTPREEVLPVTFRRQIVPMCLSGLQIDSDCKFFELATSQAAEIRAFLEEEPIPPQER